MLRSRAIRIGALSILCSSSLSQKVRLLLRLHPARALTPFLLGQTPVGTKLKEVVDIYIPKLEDRRAPHKPVKIIIATDGIPSASRLLRVLAHAVAAQG